jgi:hypothetical protein
MIPTLFASASTQIVRIGLPSTFMLLIDNDVCVEGKAGAACIA